MFVCLSLPFHSTADNEPGKLKRESNGDGNSLQRNERETKRNEEKKISKDKTYDKYDINLQIIIHFCVVFFSAWIGNFRCPKWICLMIVFSSLRIVRSDCVSFCAGRSDEIQKRFSLFFCFFRALLLSTLSLFRTKRRIDGYRSTFFLLRRAYSHDIWARFRLLAVDSINQIRSCANIVAKCNTVDCIRIDSEIEYFHYNFSNFSFQLVLCPFLDSLRQSLAFFSSFFTVA